MSAPIPVEYFDSGSSTVFRAGSWLGGVQITRLGRKYLVDLSLEVGSDVGEVDRLEAGIGTFSEYIFDLQEQRECPFLASTGDSKRTIHFEFDGAFPCEGFVGHNGAAFVVAPAVRISTRTFGPAWMMILEPLSRDLRLTVTSPSLTVSHKNSAAVVNLSGDNSLEGTLHATGGDFDSVKVVSYRTIRIAPPVEDIQDPETRFDVLPQTLAELRSPGDASFVWSQVVPTFEPTVWVSSPAAEIEVDTADPLALVKQLGPTGIGSDDVILGEGPLTGHLLQLVMHTNSFLSEDKKAITQFKLT